MKGRILFLTTASLTLKPRLVKEIKAARSFGLDVDLISLRRNDWTLTYDNNLSSSLAIKNHSVDVGKDRFIKWVVVSAMHKIAVILWKFGFKNIYVGSFASNKNSIYLFLFLLTHPALKNYSMAIGRNIGPIVSLIHFRKRWQNIIGFDVEDYHPYENVTWTNPYEEKKRRYLLLNAICKYSSYLTVASPLIEKKLLEELKITERHSIVHLRNSFFSNEFEVKSLPEGQHLEFVWFSIDIGYNRGLEQIIPILSKFGKEIRLTLIGNLNKDFEKSWVEPHDFVSVLPTLSPEKLNSILSTYDIGLAIENDEIDKNRSLCWTNKIFAYTQAGLFVLGTTTEAQKKFFETNAVDGMLFSLFDASSIEKCITFLIENKEKIKKEKIKRYNAQLKLDWTHDMHLIHKIWTKIL